MSQEPQARRIDEVRDYVKRTRERLLNGRAELDRLHESIESTNRHIASISEWLEETQGMPVQSPPPEAPGEVER
ncbi:MAG TPA: hypothetical protein VGL76_09340 [Gaiellaceae bacterium]|jgi:uncharacterized coiled-coil DUF342 family protein